MMILRVRDTSVLQNGNDISALRRFGVTSELAESGQEALEYLRLYDYDLVLIDLHLPDVPGHEVIRKIRAEGYPTPAVVMANRATPAEKVRSLDQGADDIIVGPCGDDELLARLRAVIRRNNGHTRSSLRVGRVELSLDRHEVDVNGKKLALTRREFAVMELLFLKQGVILNKSVFLNHLYCGTEEPGGKAIDVTICRLRKKLADAGVPDLIDTVWGCGYIVREPHGVAIFPARASMRERSAA